MQKLLLVIIALSIQILIFSNISLAQDSNSESPSQRGIYIGASLLGASWNLPAYNFDPEGGAGIGLRLGYSFNENFALFTSLDGSSINPDQGNNYGLGHFDLGAEGRLGSDNFKAFGRASYLGMAVVSNDPSGDIEISGAGFGLGAGLYYFPTNHISLEVAYTHSWVNIQEVKIGSNSSSVDEEAESGRFSIGIAYHF